MIDLERLKGACAYVEAAGQRGSGYLIAPRHLATCDHVVSGCGPGQRVLVRFPAGSRWATVENRDPAADCAVLLLEAPLDNVAPLPRAGSCRFGDLFVAYGSPAVAGEDSIPLSGAIRDPAGSVAGNPALILFSENAAAGKGGIMKGLSGSPVLVGGAVVGHLRRVIVDPNDAEGGERAELGLLYACPIRFVEQLLPPSAEAPRPRPQPPGAAYQPAWYVHRDIEEKAALSLMESRGAPAVLWGPELFGKTWLLKHLLSQLRKQQDVPVRISEIDLGMFDRQSRTDAERFFYALALQLLGGNRSPHRHLLSAWKDSEDSTVVKLSELLEEQILPQRDGLLVLAIDRADALLGAPFQDDFFSMLRAWAEGADHEPWSRLRLLLAVSTTPAALTKEKNRSPFNMTPAIRLRDLDPDQIEALLSLHGLRGGPDEIARLRGLIGGHPYLIRLVMDTAARESVPLHTLLQPQAPLFDDYLSRLRGWLGAHPDLKEAFRAVARNHQADLAPEVYHRLHRAGLIVEEGTQGYRLRYQLYQRLAR